MWRLSIPFRIPVLEYVASGFHSHNKSFNSFPDSSRAFTWPDTARQDYFQFLSGFQKSMSQYLRDGREKLSIPFRIPEAKRKACPGARKILSIPFRIPEVIMAPSVMYIAQDLSIPFRIPEMCLFVWGPRVPSQPFNSFPDSSSKSYSMASPVSLSTFNSFPDSRDIFQRSQQTYLLLSFNSFPDSSDGSPDTLFVVISMWLSIPFRIPVIDSVEVGDLKDLLLSIPFRIPEKPYIRLLWIYLYLS